jgi:hypothetical protein
MVDFEIQRCSRRCAETDREFQPGEEFYSLLVAEGARVKRLDYSREVWREPPPAAIGWWKSHMPEPNAKRLHWAPNDVMLHYFEQLEGDADRADLRYVLALLLIRRRVVRLEEARRDADGRELMILYSPKHEKEYALHVVEPSAERVRQIQDELSKLLFADAS